MFFETKRLTVRKFEESDLNNLHLLLSDENVMKYPFDKKHTKEFLFSNGLIETPRIYAVEKNRTFVGYAIYHDYEKDSIEIGWVLFPQYWNNGFASELTETMIQIAKSNNKRLIIECDKEQVATIAIANKFGFSLIDNDNGLYIFKL